MAYTLETVSESLEQNLPSLSPTAAKVMQLAGDINCPPAELTRVIKLDPVLSAKVLRLANSSYFGLNSRVASLEKAIIMLGLNTIKNLALGAAVLSQMESEKVNAIFDGEGFWSHSLGVGVAAKLIAARRAVQKKELENYFIAGLIHDIGLLVETQIFPEEMKRIVMVGKDVGLIEAEETVLEGLTHCGIGKLLGERWGLGEDLVTVIAGHHGLVEITGKSDLNNTVYLANIICKNAGKGMVLDRVPRQPDPAVYNLLGVESGLEREILENHDNEVEKAKEFLKA